MQIKTSNEKKAGLFSEAFNREPSGGHGRIKRNHNGANKGAGATLLIGTHLLGCGPVGGGPGVTHSRHYKDILAM